MCEKRKWRGRKKNVRMTRAKERTTKKRDRVKRTSIIKLTKEL